MFTHRLFSILLAASLLLAATLTWLSLEPIANAPGIVSTRDALPSSAATTVRGTTITGQSTSTPTPYRIFLPVVFKAYIYFTPTPTATPTPTPTFYWKPGGWIDYAPSGVPDFDQRQDKWGVGAPGTPGWAWTYCGPVAVANSLWWFDSKFETGNTPPPHAGGARKDTYNLVTAYFGSPDDHDPLNVDNPGTPPGPNGELVEDLAWRMDTDGQRMGIVHRGTNVMTMFQAIQQYLADKGLANAYTVTLIPHPTFDWVAREVLRSEDVILLLGFWEPRATGQWVRIGGHYVTAAGVDRQQNQIAFSDPARDNAEVGGQGRVLPAPHGLPHPATLHNDAVQVSHDIWTFVRTDSPGGVWGPLNYGDNVTFVQGFIEQNVPDEFAQYTGPYQGGPLQTEVEYAIAVSPVEVVPTPTPTGTWTPTLAPPTPTATATRPPVATPTFTPTGTRTRTPTPTPTATATPRVTATWTPTATPTDVWTPTLTPTATPTPTFYWKAGGWIDYAPSGVPDFDQRQDKWGVGGAPGAPGWAWTYCGPVAVANSLWWFDSKFETGNTPPPHVGGAPKDTYSLVTAYPGSPDDHDPLNVDNPNTPPGPPQPPGELVEDLAWRMDTDGQRTGGVWSGTRVMDMGFAIGQYIADHGLMLSYTVVITQSPGFPWVEDEVKRSEDVILLLGFWQNQDGVWRRIGGHYVTVVGVDSENLKIAFSDPYHDRAEVTGIGRVLPPHPAHPLVPTLHNDAQFVSHDIYSVVLQSPSPGGHWGLEGYPIYPEDMANFLEQNVPPEFQQSQGAYNSQLPVYVEVEYAIAVSPVVAPPGSLDYINSR